MRVSHNMIYSQATRNMNSLLADILRYNEQYASQKKVNRPSDDPGGMARSLDLTSQIAAMTQYQENIDTAEAWLSLADDELQKTSDVLTSIRELCEQAATGTLTADQRAVIADEARQLMEQIVGIANSEYAGDNIFGGSVLDGSAFTMGLGATVQDEDSGTAEVLEVTGAAEATIYVEFLDSGTVGTDELQYRYTDDGGSTWTTGTLASNASILDLGTARAELSAGSVVTASPEAGEAGGTAIWVRPAAFYHGDDDTGVETLHYGDSPVTAQCSGVFDSTAVIRLDSDGTLSSVVEYSYSLDNGSTWVTGNTTSDATFTLPGGHVTLASNGGDSLSSGDQFLVRPYSSALEVNIGPSSSVQINNVGMDIFGGQYTPAGEDYPELADPDHPETNLLEAVGRFIGFLETNNQEGVSQCLEELTTSQEHLSTAMGRIGGREVRLEFASAGVSQIKETATANVSDIVDADVATLTTALAKVQTIYQAVLETSSNIMGMSLFKYM